VDLFTSITIGTATSLALSLLLRPMWTHLAFRNGSDSHWQIVNTRTEAWYLGAHALAGASQGFLFWLSWGLAALTMRSWWLHGLIVGIAYTVLLIVPVLICSASVVRISKQLWWVLLGETVLISVAVGLACSWNWTHGR
jgi:hypothetical protein